jgi:hypothetical protein
MVASNQSFASPTESEFSDIEGPESAKNWDEERVCDWLRSINCGDYEKIFRKNNITGENLLEMDKAVLQEMGIDKIGDRVRLFLGIKKLRTKAYANQKKRNRVGASNPLCTQTNQIGLFCWLGCFRIHTFLHRLAPTSKLRESSYADSSGQQEVFQAV